MGFGFELGDKNHTRSKMPIPGSHGNRICQTHGRPLPPSVSVRKIPVSEGPWYAEDISRDGRTVWAAFDGDELLCIAATADKVRSKCRDILRAERKAAYGGHDAPYKPQEGEGQKS
jgi:hypothetical protein